MPNIKISDDAAEVLPLALVTYQQEVVDIANEIRAEAARAALPADRYVPEHVSKETELTEQSLQIVKHFSADVNSRLFGRQVDSDYLRVMHSALILYRDDLESRLRVVEVDPLAPSEAAQPLRDRVANINCEIARFWSNYGESQLLREVQRRRVLKSGVGYPRDLPLDTVLANLEGQEIEFIEQFPSQAHDLAKEIAAFATSNPGTIYLGVSDDGVVVGLPDLEDTSGRDKFRTRIEGICSNSVVPSVVTEVGFQTSDDKVIAVVKVPKGPQPIYYSNRVPYIRHGSTSRPAQPQEVIDLVQRYLQRK